jgi:hypothetical protein
LDNPSGRLVLRDAGDKRGVIMILLNIAVFVGLILLYFVNAAFKVDIFNWEMFIHSGIRFFTGFLILGIGFFYEQKIGFKIAVYLVLALILTDDILDYYRGVTKISPELVLHGIYMLAWGCLVGYSFIRYIKIKANNNL